MKHYLPLVICLSLSLAAAVSGADAPTVKELIHRLGSDDFEEREKATKLLLEREEALPELRKAMHSDDAEVRRRASEIIDGIEQRQAKRGLARAASLAKAGKPDQAVERLVRWGKWDKEGASLESLSDLARDLLEREKKQFGKVQIKNPDGKGNVANPLEDFAAFSKLVKTEGSYRTDHSRLPIVYEGKRWPCFVTRGAGVTAKVKSMIFSLIASSGDISVRADGIVKTLFVACGSVTLEDGEHTNKSVIICDGDVIITCDNVHDCLIIAGGDVTLPDTVIESAVFAGGSIKQSKRGELVRSVIRENEKHPLGLIRFFDPAEAGIEVAADKGAVQVKAAAKGKPFAEAGLCAGDLVTQINGARTPSPEEFRKRLRAALADGGPTMTLTVQREGKTLTVPVAVKD
jgi:PDZ domain